MNLPLVQEIAATAPTAECQSMKSKYCDNLLLILLHVHSYLVFVLSADFLEFLVFDELTNGQAGRAHLLLVHTYVHVVTKSSTVLDGAYSSALLFAHWSVRQTLSHVISVQLRHSVHAFKQQHWLN